MPTRVPIARRLAASSIPGLSAFLVLAAIGAAAAAPAQDICVHKDAAASDAATGVSVALADVDVLTAAGALLQFRSQVIGDRVVAINFIFTSCATICPVLTGIFQAVQDELGDRLGRDAWLITVSIDPANDTPARMRQMAASFGARPGWLWITGSRDSIDAVLKGLDAYTPDIASHPPMVIVGDGRRKQWSRLYGFVGPEDISQRLQALAVERAAIRVEKDTGGGER